MIIINNIFGFAKNNVIEYLKEDDEEELCFL